MSRVSKHIDPLVMLRRRERWLWITAMATVTTAGVWALRPLPIASLSVPSVSDPSTPENVTDHSKPHIDPRVFAIALWNPPSGPSQEIPVAAQPPSKPPNLQLIGVITEGEIVKAALYDVESDRVLIVADGDSIRDQKVRIHTHDGQGAVELSNGQSVVRLTLRPDKPPNKREGGPGRS